MKTLWRLVKRRHAAQAFSGGGARLRGGRWNLAGDAVVYVSESLALAALELFVHLTGAGRHIEFVSFRVEVPDDVQIDALSKNDLPPNWRDEPAPEDTQIIGSDWVKRGGSVLLQVPSILIPTEHNFVINPAHADFHRLIAHPAEPFSIDPRMWKHN